MSKSSFPIGRGAAASLLAAALALPALAGPGAHGPDGEHLEAPGAAAASGLARLPDGSVQMPKLAQRRLGIRTVIAPQTTAAASVELPARVAMDPNAGGLVQAAHGGRVEPGPGGLPVPGQAVRRGEVLAYVRHHADPFEAAGQRARAAELRAARQVAEQRAERLEGLAGTVPRKEIEAARAELAGLRQQERAIGAGLATRQALAAPVSGVIARADAAHGQVVDEKDVLFEIVDPARLLVEASTADPALAQRIESASLAGIEGVTLRLVGIGRALRDGRLPVVFRATADADAPPLAVGQPVTVVAQTRERVPGIVLPAGAVVRNAANETAVWVKAGAERFVPQPVTVRPLGAGTVLVTGGLAADNRVVVQGAAMLAQVR
jgi:hypothetical protein